jgi:Spy/CpxP family protein refolding chaperone
MKPWIKRTLIGVFGASILLGGLAACSHRHHGWSANMNAEESAQFRGKMVDRVSSKLDLNEDQKKRLTALADKLHEQRAAMMGQSKDPRAEPQTLLSEKTAAIQARSPEVIAALADFYDSLTPAQQQKVREFMQQRGRWFHRG